MGRRAPGDRPTAGTMGRRAQPGGPDATAPARTRTGPTRDAAARSPHAGATGPGRPRAPGAARTGGGPVVNASPTGVLSRSGPCGSSGGPERNIHVSKVTVSQPLASPRPAPL